jgi:hypothetical protein
VKTLAALLLVSCLPLLAQTRRTPIEIQCHPAQDDSVGQQLCSALRDIVATSPRYEELPHNPNGFILKILTVSCMQDRSTAFSVVLARGPIYLDGGVRTCNVQNIRRCAQDEFAHQDGNITILSKVAPQ